LLSNSYAILFPPLNFKFECFIDKSKESDTDALLYVPDSFAYYTGIFLVLIGFITGLVLIIFGYVNQKLAANKDLYISLFYLIISVGKV
jgi:hypothetical protein